MSKLFKLKKWLTVPDAAKHLTIVFGEEVTEADVLRFALDGELKLSVHLVNGSYGCPCIPVKYEEIQWDEMPTLDGKGICFIPKAGRVWQDQGQWIQAFRSVIKLDDAVWDLPMDGGEKYDVEHRYQLLTGGPEVSTVSLEGVFVRGAGGHTYELQERHEDPEMKSIDRSFMHSDNFHPASALPEDSVFVIRTDVLTTFIKAVDETTIDTEKALTTTERNTLLKLVIGMAIKGYGHDPASSKSTSPKEIADDLAASGMAITDDTVRKYLKQAADTVLPKKQRQP